MKKTIIFSLVFMVSSIFSQRKDTLIIFSEIMFYNSTSIPNGEFIELYNTSYTDTIDIANWKIKYYTSSPNLIVSAGMGTRIKPRQYAVIFEGDYVSGYNVPSGALILRVSGNNFGTTGMANTADRDVHLLNASNDTVWSYFYTANNSAGYSDEKIIMIGSNIASNWSNSLVLNGTPGAANSVSPKEYDIQVASIVAKPLYPVINDDISISAIIKNLGLLNATNFSVSFKYDLNNDRTWDVFVPAKNISLLVSKDSIVVDSDSLIKRIQSPARVLCEINFDLDQNSANDTLSLIIEPGLPRNSIVINEIMFDPRTGEPEWIELFNNTNNEVNLNSWEISDVLASPTVVRITNDDFYFQPKSFLVIAVNSKIFDYYDSIPSPIFYVSIPALNNDKDGVVIYDKRGAVIDSVFYFSSWGASKKSLERISVELPSNLQSNWAASIADSGATPGRTNSVSNVKSYARNSIVINEIMYEPLSGNAEYIELYNSSNDTINLAGWQIKEKSNNTFFLSSRTFYLLPDEYFILVSDSSIFSIFPYLKDLPYRQYIRINQSSDLSLSNSGDIITLTDLFRNVIDSVSYLPSWHYKDIEDTRGRALERINPILNSNDEKNWSTSTNYHGGTPLMRNSVFTKVLPSKSKVEFSQNPFSPDFDGFEDFTVITYKLPIETSKIRIRIYDSYGRLVRTLVDNQPSSSEGMVTFDGLDDEKNPLRIGIYIVSLEAFNLQHGVIEAVKKPLVVAKKLK